MPRNQAAAASPGRRIVSLDHPRFWFALALALGAVGSAAFLYTVSTRSGGLTQDAEQFLSWMGRWDDPAPLRNDLVADYWSAVTPWFFKAVYKAAWLAGIPPVRFARALPALLTPLVALFAFRFARAIGAAPPVAFFAAAMMLLFLMLNPITMLSGMPRAFWPLLLLVVMDGLARRSAVEVSLGQLLLAGTYPQIALVAALMIGLTLFDPSARRIDLSRARLTLVAGAAAATVLGIVPFLLQNKGFGPAVVEAQARMMPIFQAGNPSQMFKGDGSIDFLCGRRTGFLPCYAAPRWMAWTGAITLCLAASILFLRSLRERQTSGDRMRSYLPACLIAASLACFVAATLVFARLHLPGRYPRALPPLWYLVALPLAVEWFFGQKRLWSRLPGLTRPAIMFLVFAFVAGTMIRTALDQKYIHRAGDPQLLATIRALPRDAVVAGLVPNIGSSPLLTNRSTLFSSRVSVPYELGYFRPLEQRMGDMATAVLTPDPALLAQLLERHRVSLLVIPAGLLAAPRFPGYLEGIIDPGTIVNADGASPTALARLGGSCERRRFRNDVLALDAECLVRAARAPAPAGTGPR